MALSSKKRAQRAPVPVTYSARGTIVPPLNFETSAQKRHCCTCSCNDRTDEAYFSACAARFDKASLLSTMTKDLVEAELMPKLCRPIQMAYTRRYSFVDVGISSSSVRYGLDGKRIFVNRHSRAVVLEEFSSNVVCSVRRGENYAFFDATTTATGKLVVLAGSVGDEWSSLFVYGEKPHSLCFDKCYVSFRVAPDNSYYLVSGEGELVHLEHTGKVLFSHKKKGRQYVDVAVMKDGTIVASVEDKYYLLVFRPGKEPVKVAIERSGPMLAIDADDNVLIADCHGDFDLLSSNFESAGYLQVHQTVRGMTVSPHTGEILMVTDEYDSQALCVSACYAL